MRTLADRSIRNWVGGSFRLVGSRRLDANGHVLDAVDEVAAQADHIPGGLDVREPREQLLEHHAHLQAGQGGAKAEMRPACSEREVAVRRARDVEAEGV